MKKSKESPSPVRKSPIKKEKRAAAVAASPRAGKAARKPEAAPAERPDLGRFEKTLGHTFGNRDYLENALVHRSWVNERKLSPTAANERLEFLGDAVLDLSVTQAIMARFPEYTEGQLSKLRASIVNEQKLATLAKKLGLGAFLYLGKGEERSGGREKKSILADAYEAVLAAVYLDGGLPAADKLVKIHLKDAIRKAPEAGSDRDFKTLLQEECQAVLKVAPEYRLISTSGPDHQKQFKVELSVRGKRMAQGTGRTKKQAEQRAAGLAYKKIRAQRALRRASAAARRKKAAGKNA